MTEGIKSKDLLKCGKALAQGYQDGIKSPCLWADAVDAASRAGEALGRAAKGIADFVRAMVELAAAVIPAGYLSVAKSAAEIKVALNEAQPRVRHLALYGKKGRTRKKNINRALREYRRRTKA